MLFREVGNPRFQRAEKPAHTVCRPPGSGWSNLQKRLQRHPDDFGRTALCSSRRALDGAAELPWEPDGQLVFHARKTTLQCNAFQGFLLVPGRRLREAFGTACHGVEYEEVFILSGAAGDRHIGSDRAAPKGG